MDSIEGNEMRDGMTSDQLSAFIAAAEDGSFSGAGRELKRTQSVVSQTLANLELQIGVKFVRSEIALSSPHW